ncbi:hypothetical protein B0H10DRAFT_2057061 [Mycena sp. CBHHK59/15]|nr:hypothetical protein B0H10DRAFT_2057061 [Mycena sp. CBHHK59/15]
MARVPHQPPGSRSCKTHGIFDRKCRGNPLHHGCRMAQPGIHSQSSHDRCESQLSSGS